MTIDRGGGERGLLGKQVSSSTLHLLSLRPLLLSLRLLYLASFVLPDLECQSSLAVLLNRDKKKRKGQFNYLVFIVKRPIVKGWGGGQQSRQCFYTKADRI